MAGIIIDRLGKRYGQAVAVEDFSIGIGDGELVAFLGPSGCGKTTTLRMVAGFIEPSAGSIRIGDRDITHVPAHRRNTGMVFQRYGLFPHMTVRQNISFGLEMRRLPARLRGEKVDAALEMVRLGSLGERYPRQLSGGQQQRVALARALVVEPDVLLLDEPLSNLDAKLRVDVRDEIRALQRRLGLTTIFVTHDQEEALAVADRLVIMDNGRVQQVGSGSKLYEQPASRFVADFLGKMNFLDGSLAERDLFVSHRGTRIIVGQPVPGAKSLGLRPEHIQVLPTPVKGSNSVPVRVSSTAYLGSIIEIRMLTEAGDAMVCHVQNRPDGLGSSIAAGDSAHAVFGANSCMTFI